MSFGPTWLIDLDGVIWLGDTVIPGARDAVGALRARNQRVAFFTNNSSVTRAELLAKLESFGIAVAKEELLTSSEAAAAMCSRGERAFVLGGAGIREALQERGVIIVEAEGMGTAVPVDVVVVGLDRELNFARLTIAMRAIRGGARFLATNEDATFPVGDGLLPGAGALVTALTYATGVRPVVAGKPNAGAVELVRARLGEVNVVVGDRPSTDGELARRLGACFGLVYSGVTRPGEIPPDIPPDLEASDIAVLLAKAFERT